jgi:hypothetical protein
MISGLLSAAVLDKEFQLDSDMYGFVWEKICKSKHAQFFLWEGIIPYCLAEVWAMSNIQGTRKPDRNIFILLRDLLSCNGNENRDLHLPGPYCSLEEVVFWKYRVYLQKLRSDIDRDDYYRRSWFAEPLFYLLVRRNYKGACKTFWPELTRFRHARTRLPNANAFGPMLCNDAVSEDKIIDVSRTKTWSEAISDATASSPPLIPPQLSQKPALVLLYCLFVPQRMDCDVILWLDRAFCRSWY